MALDNNNGKRKPHTRQEEFEEQKRALEDRIVNDKDMASKIYQRAMEAEYGTQKAVEAEDASSGSVSEGPEGRRSERRASVQAGDLQRRAGAGQAASEQKSGTETEAADAPEKPRAFHAYSLKDEAGQKEESAEPGSRAARRTGATDAQGRRNVRQMNAAGDSEAEIQRKRQDQRTSKKNRKRNIILACIVELLTLVVIFGFGVVVRYMNMTQPVEFDKANVRNENIDISKQQAMEGYWTVAVFGVDDRNGSVGKGANADVQIIANIDMGTGDIKLVSVYRDTYLNVNKNNRYAKANEAYASGGPEQAVQTLNKNLDLNIENYVTFNWKAVADAINLLGGVEAEITSQEFYYMNAFIHETCIETGISALNPAAEYIDGPGQQHLDGIQAVAYARLRKMDTDFARTERQRHVIEQCLEKAKQADLATLLQIIDTVLPQIAFNIDYTDIVQLAKGISRYNIVETTGFPMNLDTQMMGSKGDCVIPVTLSSNVTKLHAFLFGDEDYNPTDAVKRYSSKIADDSGKYKSGYYDDSGQVRTTEAETTEADEEEESRSSTSSTRVDSEGYLIRGTDADGEYIYETDEDGNKIKPRETTKADTSSTDQSSGTKPQLVETDENGETIESTRGTGDASLAPGESRPGATGESTGATRPSTNPTSGTSTAPTVNPTADSTTEAAPVLPGESSSAASSTTAASRPSTLQPGGDSTTGAAVPTPTTAATRPTVESTTAASGGGPGSSGPGGTSSTQDAVPVFPGA